MKLNLDVVPKDLDDAVKLIIEGIEEEEREEFNDPVGLHFSFGMYLRNNWSLWDKENRLVKWFVEKLGIIHADDISSTILSAVSASLKKESFNPSEHVQYYINYWLENGLNPKTMDKIDDGLQGK